MNGDPAEQSEGASRRSVVLVTGMSGTESRRCSPSWNAADTASSTPTFPVGSSRPAGGREPVWDLNQIKSLIDGYHTGWLFIGGCVANQGAVRDRFEAVVLLSAPVDVILERVANRTNPFGSTAEDRSKIASDLATVEPLLRVGADHEIVTTAPVSEVVAELERVATGAGHQDPLRAHRADQT